MVSHPYLIALQKYVDKSSEVLGISPISPSQMRTIAKVVKVAEVLVASTSALAILYLHSIFLLPVILGPSLFVHAFPFVYVASKVKEYKLRAEKSALSLSLATYVLALTGRDLITALSLLAKKGDYVSGVESAVLESKVRLQGISLPQAVKQRADALKGTALASLYSLYVSTQELGLSLSARLEGLIKALTLELKKSIENRITFLTELNEVILAVYLLLPMLVLGFGFLGNGDPLLLVAPLVAAPGLYAVVSSNSIEPLVSYKLGKMEIASIIAFVVGTIAIVSLGLSYSLVLILFGVSVATPIYLKYSLPSERIYRLLPFFLTRLGDQLRLGYNLRESWERAINEMMRLDRSYSKVKAIEGGTNFAFMAEIWRLTQIAYEGGYHAVYDEMARVLSDIVSLRKDYEAKTRPLFALAMLAPALLLYTVHTFATISQSLDVRTIVNLIDLDILSLVALYSKAVKGSLFYFPAYVIAGVEGLILSMWWFSF
ncbi:MAG: hypothetical protein ACP5HQ_06385 [Thermoprotei archaeon]